MKVFRLKKEAVPFFKEAIATAIMPLDSWAEAYHINEAALEEVKPVYIKYGHDSKPSEHSSSTSLCGWDENGSHFHFTIYFPSAKYKEYDKFNKGKIVREMMDKIQSSIDSYFINFIISDGEINQ